MANDNFWMRLALGAAAGLAGTVALQIIRKTNQKVLPRSSPPIKQDPGEFMVQKAEQLLPETTRIQVPVKVEATAAKLLAMGYGMTFGALYASARPQTKRTLLEGALLGIAAWAAGYLGWLPASGLMTPVWKHKPVQIAMPVAEHALYGMATVAGYRWLKDQVAA
jgi:hypothetical protein